MRGHARPSYSTPPGGRRSARSRAVNGGPASSSAGFWESFAGATVRRESPRSGAPSPHASSLWRPVAFRATLSGGDHRCSSSATAFVTHARVKGSSCPKSNARRTSVRAICRRSKTSASTCFRVRVSADVRRLPRPRGRALRRRVQQPLPRPGGIPDRKADARQASSLAPRLAVRRHSVRRASCAHRLAAGPIRRRPSQRKAWSSRPVLHRGSGYTTRPCSHDRTGAGRCATRPRGYPRSVLAVGPARL